MKGKNTFHTRGNKVVNGSIAWILLFTLLCSFKFTTVHATVWTTSTAGAVNNLANWTDGTTSPSSFTTPGDKWLVTLAMTLPASVVWTLGTTAATPDTLQFDSGGSLTMSGAGSTFTIEVYGSIIINGGTFSLGGAGTTCNTSNYGSFIVSSGTISSTGSSTHLNITVNGNYSMTAGTATTTGSSSQINTTVNGNYAMSGGTVVTNSAGPTITTNVNGNFSMTGGLFEANGASSTLINNIYGNCSYSGPAAMTNTGAGCTSTVHLALPTVSGTMLIDNTSTGAWSKTTIYVDAGCTAQLAGNFHVSMGISTSSVPYGMIVNGTLICPAAFVINGTGGAFVLSSGGTLKVAHATGINGAITNTGTKTFSTSGNYEFNGSVAQVTGSFLPAALVAPDSIIINNAAGVTLTQTTSTTGTLLFGSGILHTGAFTMTTPGDATAVVGAGLTSYVEGTLIKTITGYTSVNYEVGDLSYAPMLLSFSSAGTAGTLALKTTNGLHPNVGTSAIMTTSIANHYWTITNSGAAGPATVTPRGTYNLADIIGGTNASFKTQQYRSAAWLVSPLVSTNTAAPYSTTSNTGFTLATLAGDFIFGSDCSTSPITGSPMLCVGGTTALSDIDPGGTWGSTNTAVATVSATGVVFGVTTGTATIEYTTTCPASIMVTVGTAPITGGTTTICAGSTTTFSNATAGGAWSSDNTTVATVSSSGVVSGIAPGIANISYTFGPCTPVSVAVSVITPGGITGSNTLCTGGTNQLSNSISGGTWSSSNTSIATVSSSGVVSGVAAGTVDISYAYGSCSPVWMTVTVGVLPVTGSTGICIGSTTSLTDATPGGTWTSSNTAVATVDASGVVTGVASGSSTISYNFGSCTPATLVVTVGNPAPITGNTSLCSGSSPLSDATAGGAWSSGNTAVATVSGTGVVFPVSSGTSVITYTTGSCYVTTTVTVTVVAGITGGNTVCVGSTLPLSDVTPGGAWSSSNVSVITVSASGVVTGVSAGSANITYTVGSCTAILAITVGSVPAISGTPGTCVGGTTTLSNSSGGGVWSSSNTSVATIDASGVMTGVATGGATITYTVGGCFATLAITVTNLPPVTGPATVCTGATITLSNPVPGGTWSSGNTAVATVSTSGVVTGVAQGTATISYSGSGCTVTANITVDANSAGIISGKDTVCKGPGHEVSLSSTVSGGVWSSSNTSRATVDPVTGVVTGVTSSQPFIITYTVNNSCGSYTVTYSMYVRSATKCAAGIDENAGITELKLFPNPNDGTFTVNLSSALKEDVHFVITNIVGAVMKEYNTTTNVTTSVQLDAPPGIYVLTATTTQGRYVVKVTVR